jgi:hypothetical protein
MLHECFGCPATSPKSGGLWPFFAIFFSPPLSSIAGRYQLPWYPIQCTHLLYHVLFPQHIARGILLSPVNIISPMGEMGHHFDTI